MNASLAHLFSQVIGYQKVINSPSGVVFPGVEAVAPPAVGPGQIWVEVAEGVGEASFQQPGKALPLFVGETGVATVGARVF